MDVRIWDSYGTWNLKVLGTQIFQNMIRTTLLYLANKYASGRLNFCNWLSWKLGDFIFIGGVHEIFPLILIDEIPMKYEYVPVSSCSACLCIHLVGCCLVFGEINMTDRRVVIFYIFFLWLIDRIINFSFLFFCTFSLLILISFFFFIRAGGLGWGTKGVLCNCLPFLVSLIARYVGHIDISVTSAAFVVAIALLVQRGNPRFAQLSSAMFGLFYCGYLPCFWVKLRCGLSVPSLNTSTVLNYI